MYSLVLPTIFIAGAQIVSGVKEIQHFQVQRSQQRLTSGNLKGLLDMGPGEQAFVSDRWNRFDHLSRLLLNALRPCRSSYSSSLVSGRQQSIFAMDVDVAFDKDKEEQNAEEPIEFVPRVGDVVKVPSKWAGEWNAGVIDFIRNTSDSAQLDLQILESIGRDMYQVKSDSDTEWYPSFEVRPMEFEYFENNLTYRLNSTELIREVRPVDPAVTARYLAEYEEMKAILRRDVALLGAGGTAVLFALFGSDLALAFGTGSVASYAYLLLLQSKVDGSSMNPIVKAFANYRLFLPGIVFLLLAERQASAAGKGPLDLFGDLSFPEAAAAALGLLLFKVAILARNAGTFFEAANDALSMATDSKDENSE